MPDRTFRPTSYDVLEDRLVMTAFAIPFELVTPPPAEVNPKDLVVSKHAETQMSYNVTASFNRFTKAATSAEVAYEKGLAKPGANSAVLASQLQAKVGGALNRLTSDLNKIAVTLPYGGKNLAPVFDARIEGSAGVTDTTTNITYPSLGTSLQSAFNEGSTSAAVEAITTAQTFVRADEKNYINLGISYGDFKLGQGAIFPEIS